MRTAPGRASTRHPVARWWCMECVAPGASFMPFITERRSAALFAPWPANSGPTSCCNPGRIGQMKSARCRPRGISNGSRALILACVISVAILNVAGQGTGTAVRRLAVRISAPDRERLLSESGQTLLHRVLVEVKSAACPPPRWYGEVGSAGTDGRLIRQDRRVARLDRKIVRLEGEEVNASGQAVNAGFGRQGPTGGRSDKGTRQAQRRREGTACSQVKNVAYASFSRSGDIPSALFSDPGFQANRSEETHAHRYSIVHQIHRSLTAHAARPTCDEAGKLGGGHQFRGAMGNWSPGLIEGLNKGSRNRLGFTLRRKR